MQRQIGGINMTDSNKNAAVFFLQLASSGKVREVYSRFVGDEFRHHNPFFEGSAESLQAAMEANARQNLDKILEVKRVIVDGEFVVTHSHIQQRPGDLGAAVVHIFRFKEGRIVELWDLGQPLPEESPNIYGMF
jgi:predicted SnoaL-like aldol condensation-catalyzing enzyme